MTNKTKKQMNKAQMKNTKGGALAIYGIRRYWAGSKDGGSQVADNDNRDVGPDLVLVDPYEGIGVNLSAHRNGEIWA